MGIGMGEGSTLMDLMKEMRGTASGTKDIPPGLRMAVSGFIVFV